MRERSSEPPAASAAADFTKSRRETRENRGPREDASDWPAALDLGSAFTIRSAFDWDHSAGTSFTDRRFTGCQSCSRGRTSKS